MDGCGNGLKKNMSRKWINLIAVLLVLAAGVSASAWYYPSQQDRDAAVISTLRANYPDRERERAQAAKYWARYRDVAASEYFGLGGRLGIYGARQHYLQAGKFERRTWPQ